MTWVVDASVAVKWLVPEALSDRADRLLARADDLLAPDLLPIEVANTLWKKVRRRELTRREADRALQLLLTGGLVLRPSSGLLGRALALADRLEHPVYDCVYVALAAAARAPLVTADEHLVQRLRRHRAVRVVALAAL